MVLKVRAWYVFNGFEWEFYDEVNKEKRKLCVVENIFISLKMKITFDDNTIRGFEDVMKLKEKNDNRIKEAEKA